MKSKTNPLSIALVPDRFATYRYTIFKRLSDFQENGFKLTIYADTEEDIRGLKLVNAAYCDADYVNGGISWTRVKNITIGHVCLWQTGMIRLALSNRHQVHVYWGEANRISTWISAIISRLRGKKVVFWTHGIYGNEKPLKGLIRRSFYRIADALLLYSDYGRELLLGHGFAADKLYVIKNSLDTQHQSELYTKHLTDSARAKEKLFGARDRVLIFVGRLSASKKLDTLLEVLRRLKKTSSYNYKLLIIGDGPQKVQLLELADKLKLKDDIVFYGACYNDEELAPLIMMADVCVSPGNIGLTAMHSLVYGTPVISHDHFTLQMPEFEAIRPGKSGAFYEYDNTDDLCARIEQVIGQIDAGTISAETCREPILKYYTQDYQSAVFKQMLKDLQPEG